MTDLDPDLSAKRIELAREPEFELGGLQVRPAGLSVEKSGTCRELQPRVMQVLVALAKERGKVVSRDRLIELCWDGRIVGDDALNRCVLALRHLAQEFEPQPYEIQTVPRVGHRLVEGGGESGAKSSSAEAWRRLPFAMLALLLLAVAAGFILWQQPTAEPEPASIAVLPFRNLGTGDPYFAEGIGEEILSRLAREPNFRVIGSSSSRQFGNNRDIREVARKLKVDYVLEGSVRRQGDRVRVNAGLLSAAEGVRLWADSYDGKLDDIFAIQQRVGAAIAAALQRRLVQSPHLTDPLVTNGEAYNLYLTARGLIRTRNRQVAPTAVDLLREAIRIDAGYAPAWASLAEAIIMRGAMGDRESFISAIADARNHARRALSLAPDLAEANHIYGQLRGYGDPEGVAHLRRAAALDPNNAEMLLGLGTALNAAGEFERELSAYRRANELDPLWYRTTGQTAMALAARGNRAAAEALGRRSMPDKDANLHILLGRIAWIFADYSEAARHWAIVARSSSPRWAHTAQRSLHEATYAAGVPTGALVDVPLPIAARDDWRAWVAAPPAPAVWKARNRDPLAAEVYRKHNLAAAKLMLNADRSRELVSTYESSAGLFGLAPGRRIRPDQIHETPVVALALREAGRDSEAERLIEEAAAEVRTVYSRGEVPFWFDADAAALFAVQGRTNEALSALERAFRRGWRQNGGADLRDIADEPAFRSLRGEPRFAEIRTRLAAHYAREREEIARLRL